MKSLFAAVGWFRHSPFELRWGLVIFALFATVALAAPWVSPQDPDQQVDPAAARLLPPGSQRWLIEVDQRVIAAERLEERAGVPSYLRLGEWQPQPSASTPEHRRFWLGTDRYGRDMASRLIFGARVSLRIGLLTAVLTLLIGLAVGGIAGLAGGLTDGLLMRFADALLAFPQLFLVLAAAAFWRTGEVSVILILAATSWMEGARLARSEVLRLKRSDHLAAARVIGVPPGRILTHHLLPLILPPVLVHAMLRVGDVILVEAALSFLGFGVQPPTASWGNLIAEATDILDRAPWIAAFPGLALALTVLAFGLIGDGLAQRLDPKRLLSSESSARSRAE